ncbi:MAG TPA: 50S ribosomal protein L17 [Candidatus Kapabacteria bacterium]|nr:50S ribosomal protein L17 [Candidatus Kapabacteria bacterium]
MRHQVAGRKLKRTHSHRKALLNNLATQLFEHKKVHTTEAKAKELRSFAEKLISKAKHALIREKQGELPTGQTIDIHNRRQVGRVIRNKAVLQELFDSIAPAVESRNGGFTRVIKTGVRRGDNARTAIIELVDFAAQQDGASSTKRKKKQTKKVESQTNTTTTKPVVEAVEEKAIIDQQSEVEQEQAVETASEQVEATASETLVFEDTNDEVNSDNSNDNIEAPEDKKD